MTLLGADGQPRGEVDGQGLVRASAATFISCDALAGMRLTWTLAPGAPPPRYLRLYFAGVSRIDTWNSWLRAPQLPPPRTFFLNRRPDSAPEQRCQVTLSAPALPIRDSTLIELALADADAADSCTALLQFPAGPWLLRRIELASQPFLSAGEGEPLTPAAVPDLAEYPPAQPQLAASGDPLGEQLTALAADAATVRDVWRLALPFRGSALLGIVEGPIAAQLWDGGVVWPEASGAYSRVWLRSALPADAVLTSAEQSLHSGYLPIAQSILRARTSQGMVTLHQTALVDAQGALRLRIQAQGDSGPPELRYHAARAGRSKSLNQPKAQASIYDPLPTELTADGLRIGDRLLAVTQSATESDGVQVDVRLPLSASSDVTSAGSFDQALQQVKAEAEQFIAAGTQLELPDPQLHNAWRTLLLHNRLFQRDGIMRYGLFPGLYDGGLFGVEEGWNIVAMAQYGHPRRAQALLERTFFDAEFLKKEGQHHQYRSGLCITYARDVYGLTQDEPALRALWPRISENAEWIAGAFQSTQVLDASGQRPVHYGLLPKHTYGGDLTEPTYSLYGSSAAWRGLRDAALLAYDLGDDRADRWAAAAAATRQNLLITAERIEKRSAQPPFLPFRTDEPGDSPSAGDYHQLFASLILETALFGWSGRWARSITDYLHATGRQTLGVARFDQWFGRLGIDAEYSRGTQLCALHRRDFGRFYLGLLGQLGLSCDPYTFVSPETAIVLFSAEEYKARMRAIAEQPARCDSDPCSAGTAVMLQYLRYLLALEERDEDDLATGTLWVGAAAPRSWFAAGQSFAALGLPTSLGMVSLRCRSTATTVTYELKTQRPLPVELFYFDAAGRRCSRKVQASGAAIFPLPR